MKWEYKTLVLFDYIDKVNDDGTNSAAELEKSLNQLGEEGWELISIIPQIASDSDVSYGDVDINITCCEEVYVKSNVCVFKREKTIN